MRGPGLRIDIQTRRTWRCGNCGAERVLPQTVTTVKCACSESPFMQLAAEPTPVRREFKAIDPFIEIDLSDEPPTQPAPPPSTPPENVSPATETAQPLPGSFDEALTVDVPDVEVEAPPIIDEPAPAPVVEKIEEPPPAPTDTAAEQRPPKKRRRGRRRRRGKDKPQGGGAPQSDSGPSNPNPSQAPS